MYIRIHRHENDTILAACDAELLGATFTDGNARITVNEAFYGGHRAEPSELSQRMNDATIMNLVGNRVVELAIAEGHAREEDVLVIDGVKHVQVVVM